MEENRSIKGAALLLPLRSIAFLLIYVIGAALVNKKVSEIRSWWSVAASAVNIVTILIIVLLAKRSGMSYRQVIRFEKGKNTPKKVTALVFGFIDMVADSIVPSIILHLLNNFYAILFTIFYSNNNLNERTVSIIQISVVLLFCISGILSFIYLAKTKKEIFKLSNNEKPLEQGAELLTLKNKISVFLVNPGVMISLSSFLLLTILSLIPQ